MSLALTFLPANPLIAARPAPLLALNFGDVLPILVVIVIIVLSVLSQVAGKLKQQPPPRPGGRPQPQARPGRPPQRQAMEDEIGEFLRRAAQRRGPQQPPPQQQPQRPVAAQVVPQQRPQPPRPRPPQLQPQPVAAEVVLERPVGGGFGQQVGARPIGSGFDEAVAQLGNDVMREEQQIEAHLHQVFDHKLSTLASGVEPPEGDAQPGPTEEGGEQLPPTAAAGLAALLTNADSVRQAIVINEILTRPEHRWGA